MPATSDDSIARGMGKRGIHSKQDAPVREVETSSSHTGTSMPETSEWSRVQWTRTSHALRALLKDPNHFSMNGARAEGEAFQKLERIRLKVIVGGRTMTIRIVIRSYEAAVADGFLLVWDEEIGDMPSEDASYYEWWDWARRQDDVHFIPFDVKSLSLLEATGTRAPHFYSWTEARSSSEEQSHHVQLIIALIEGVDDYMAIVPLKTWEAAREMSFGIETIAHGGPTWLPMCLVADVHVGQALVNVVEAQAEGKDYVNPTNLAPFHGWVPTVTTEPQLGVGTWKGLDASYERTLQFFGEIEKIGGKVFFNPYAPTVFDFMVCIPGTGFLWLEHKTQNVPMRQMFFDTDVRRSPWRPRKMFHFVYADCSDGVICVPRSADYVWSNGSGGRLPEDVVNQHGCRDFTEALQHMRTYAAEARKALITALVDLTPEDINEGLPVDRRVAPLKAVAAEVGKATGTGEDPLIGPLIRQRTARDAYNYLRRWSRTEGRGVIVTLGGGHPWGTHGLAVHDWTQEDKDKFDKYGSMPFDLQSPGISEKRCLPLTLQDNSLTRDVTQAWFPIGIRKEHWHRVPAAPKFMIIGRLLDSRLDVPPSLRSSWYLCLPSGLTGMYQDGHFLTDTDVMARDQGEHVFRPTLHKDALISKPAWKSKRSTVSFSTHFLVDKDINLTRYILNLFDGTIYRELLRVLHIDGDISVANPLLRDSQNRTFDATEYHSTLGDAVRVGWTTGFSKQGTGAREYGSNRW